MRDAQEATEAWVESAVRVAQGRGFEQIDLDDLLGGQPEAAVQVGLACVRAAHDMLGRDNGVSLRAFLMAPLEAATRLDLDLPDMSVVLDRPWTYGSGRSVPGLYIARMDNLHWDQVDEEYRRQIPVPLPGWYAEYRTWRTPEQAAAGWEYDRATYFWLND